MARPKNVLSITDLEKLLNARKYDLSKLQEQRAAAAKKLEELDQQIGKLGGTVTANGSTSSESASAERAKPRKPGKRAMNAMSLTATLASVLSGKAPMSVGDIVAGVEAAGYKSNSANFRGIVNQTLIKEKQFASPSRGLYQMK